MRILKLSIVCYGGLISLIMAVALAGGRIAPDWTDDFDALAWCGDRLCFMGIAPEITTWAQAIDILEPYGYQRILSSSAGIYGITERVEFVLTEEAKKVGSLSIDYAGFPHGARLKSVIARFGAPCSVGVTDETVEIFVLVYPQMIVGVPADRHNRPSWVADRSYSTDTAIHIRLGDFADRCNPRFVWKGFRTLGFYEDYLRSDIGS